MEYKEFIDGKIPTKMEYGFDVSYKDMTKGLFKFQKAIVKRAIKAGRYSIFADTGLGKTHMELEYAKQISQKESKPILLLDYLGVSYQTIDIGKKHGYDISYALDGENTPIQVLNYDQLHNINANDYIGVILDESSILKNETGKFRNTLIDMFATHRYKLCATATPSPNDPMELGNHAEFLNVMKYNEVLSQYFVHDGGNTSKWRLKRHGVSEFYSFISSFSIMCSKPSDVGYPDEDYLFELPKLHIIERQIETEPENGKLFNSGIVSATNFNQSLRDTQSERTAMVNNIVNDLQTAEDKEGQIVIWVHQNKEADAIYKSLKDKYDVRNVSGSQKKEQKAQDLIDFQKGEYKILITKPKIAQFGMNFQNCYIQIFASIDFSFEATYQAIRRLWRFGQKKEVQTYIITTDRQTNVLHTYKEKELKYQEMKNEMRKNIVSNQLKQVKHEPVKSTEKIEDNYRIIKGDCVTETPKLEKNSVDLTIFSPPFAELYVYSNYPQDMGNSKNYDEFFTHFKYLIPELKRVLKPGRICAVHCMDIPVKKQKEGYIGIKDMSGMLIKSFQDVGFIYHSRITIWKDPVVEMQRTKALGLLHKQLRKDSIMSRVGLPDYILLFRNEGENETPVSNEGIDVSLWQKWASPVWYDINYTNTLNYRDAKANQDEKHICPLQLDTINRLIHLYSNKGETVFSPFAGIGSEGFESLKNGRKFVGIELKDSYYNKMQKNLHGISEMSKQTQLAEMF